MNLAICIEVGWSGMLMWNNAAFKIEVQKVLWCLKAPHIQLQGWGRLRGRACSGSTRGVSVMQRPGCVGEQMKWGWFCCAGLLWFAGFAFIFQQSGFWQSTCEKCTGPLDWVAAGSAHTILSSWLCVDTRKLLRISVKSDLCHKPKMLDCFYMKVGVCRR